MNSLIIEASAFKYPIHIFEDFSRLLTAIEQCAYQGGKICIITDKNVEKLYLTEILSLLTNLTNQISVFTFHACEENKSLTMISEMYSHFAKEKLDRKALLVALGGGLTGDITGFAAATYMRGIDYINIPTTLLSQVDSSVGGKTGVNFSSHKNLIGAFYPPKLVYISLKTLHSLSYKEFSSGLGEVIKHGLIADADYLNFIISNKEKIKFLDIPTLNYIVYNSCRIKAQVVSQDEKEKDIRRILNFGHTFGHAIESASGFSIAHGHCVAAGSMLALRMSAAHSKITTHEIEALAKLYGFFEIDIDVGKLPKEIIYQHMLHDKKNENGSLNMVLLKKIGHAYIYSNATKEEIIRLLD